MKNNIEKNLMDISEILSDFQNTNQNLNNAVVSLQGKIPLDSKTHLEAISKLKKQIQDARELLSDTKNKNRPKSVEDLPGVKIPKWYEVSIPIASGTKMNTVTTGQVVINANGPFVVTQIAPFWQITDKTVTNISSATDPANFFNPVISAGPPPVLTNAPTGRILPCSAFENIINVLGITNLVSTGATAPSIQNLLDNRISSFEPSSPIKSGGFLSDIQEMAFQIEIVGSGRFWTNDFIPAPAFYGYNGIPSYMAINSYVDRMDIVKIHVKNTVETTHAGIVRFVMHGYEILGKVDITKALGY